MDLLQQGLNALLSPLSGAQDHAIAPELAWHARCMVLAWGFLVPIGILLARYWKVWPGQRWPEQLDNKNWWNLHRILQSLAVLLMSLGSYLAWQHQGTIDSDSSVHGVLGWTLLLLGWLQVVGALLRGSKGGPTDKQLQGDHFDMTARRRAFEWTHKLLGWAGLFLAIVTLGLGIIQADAPLWMPVVLLAWWIVLVCLAWRWQKQKRCIDTYQAIWGNDANLPGMSRSAIGWGISRINTQITPITRGENHETSQLH